MSSAIPTYTVELDGRIVHRGFWLYVLEATDPTGASYLYVGRTGDTPSPNAQSAYNRLSQHLGTAKNTCQMRTHLAKRGLAPEDCQFRFVAHGPIIPEAASHEITDHYPLRDRIAPVEKALADRLTAAGYEVLNEVHSRKPLNEELSEEVVSAFADHFPELSSRQ